MVGKDTPRERRRFLAAEMRRRGVDSSLISHPKHIFYLSGIPTNLHMWYSIMKGPRSTSFLAVDSEGNGALLMGKAELANLLPGRRSGTTKGLEPGVSEYVDYSLDGEMVTYGNLLSKELKRWLVRLGFRLGTVAIEEWHLAEIYRESLLAARRDARLTGISAFLLEMRNSKGRDEVSYLKKATEMVDRAYAAAKRAAKRGNQELDVYSEVNALSFRRYGPFGWVVGDYASGGRSLAGGGMPTNREMNVGETIILDLQSAYNNYWSDLCRTFVVGGRPTKSQEKALSTLKHSEEAVEGILLPGTKGKEVYASVCRVLEGAGYSKLPHHAGHCIGLDDQEPPWFIPAEERKLEEGSVCVVEPGVYGEDSGGIRIEDQYLITKRGPKKLSRFSLALS
jgi:Xaa-Pro aminopeptidase